MRIFLIKAIKFLIALFLLPALPILVEAIWKHATSLNERMLFLENALSLCLGGIAIWIMFALLFRLPTRIYVFAHELTHALFIKLCGGKVKKIAVKRDRGYVISDRSNFLITLAPYLFPFYAILLGAFSMLFHWIYSNSITLGITWVLIGFCLGYHWTMTGRMMVTRQTDFSSQGYIFSFVLILLINLSSILLLLWILPSPKGFERKFVNLSHEFRESYLATWDFLSHVPKLFSKNIHPK